MLSSFYKYDILPHSIQINACSLHFFRIHKRQHYSRLSLLQLLVWLKCLWRPHTCIQSWGDGHFEAGLKLILKNHSRPDCTQLLIYVTSCYSTAGRTDARLFATAQTLATCTWIEVTTVLCECIAASWPLQHLRLPDFLAKLVVYSHCFRRYFTCSFPSLSSKRRDHQSVYLAKADGADPNSDSLEWWKQQVTSLPAWATAAMKVLVSLLISTLGNHQDYSMKNQ